VAREVLRGAQERVSERDGVTLVPTLALAGASGVCHGTGWGQGRALSRVGQRAWEHRLCLDMDREEGCRGERAEVLRGAQAVLGDG